MKGSGVERDEAKAIKWYSQAASKGVAASQVQLGKLLYSGAIDGLRDRKLAGELLQKAADAGDLEAKMALAMTLLRTTQSADLSRASELLSEAARDGHSGAALQLGHFYSGRYSSSGSGIVTSQAIAWYTKAAESGDIKPSTSSARPFSAELACRQIR